MRWDLSKIPKNVPRELVQLFFDNHCNSRAVEQLRKVNRYYVYQLLKYGKEPTDKTKKGRKARVALFLPERKKRNTADIPEYMKLWRRLSKEERRKVIITYLKWKYSEQEKLNEKQGLHTGDSAKQKTSD